MIDHKFHFRMQLTAGWTDAANIPMLKTCLLQTMTKVLMQIVKYHHAENLGKHVLVHKNIIYIIFIMYCSINDQYLHPERLEQQDKYLSRWEINRVGREKLTVRIELFNLKIPSTQNKFFPFCFPPPPLIPPPLMWHCLHSFKVVSQYLYISLNYFLYQEIKRTKSCLKKYQLTFQK